MKYTSEESAGRSEVAPLVGAWIEILVQNEYDADEVVAPLVGAWIEITSTTGIDLSKGVAPLVGAWIEIETWEYFVTLT